MNNIFPATFSDGSSSMFRVCFLWLPLEMEDYRGILKDLVLIRSIAIKPLELRFIEKKNSIVLMLPFLHFFGGS